MFGRKRIAELERQVEFWKAECERLAEAAYRDQPRLRAEAVSTTSLADSPRPSAALPDFFDVLTDEERRDISLGVTTATLVDITGVTAVDLVTGKPVDLKRSAELS